ELLPAGGARQREEPPAPPAPERKAVHGAGDQRVRTLDAEAWRALEPATRARRADAGDPRQPAVERAVQDVEPTTDEWRHVELVREPRRQAEDAGHRQMRRRAHRDGA